MSKISSSLERSQYHGGAVIFIFILLGIAAYGLLIPYLGFYWDDYPIAWISETYGGDGLARYFSTNRPYWGLLYQITTPILGSTPWHWQVFGLSWRILSALSFWIFLRQLWPKKPALALCAGMAFLVFPGFTQQWISLVYSHFFIVATAFIASLALTLMAVRSEYEHGKKGERYLYTFLALCLSLINLIALEYFFTLELIRYVAIGIVVREYSQGRREAFQRTLALGIPYLLLMLGITIWRVFFFPYQTQNYELIFLEGFMDEPLQALTSFIQNVITSIWKTGVQAWINVFRLPNFQDIGRITAFVSFALAGMTFLMLSIWFYFLGKRFAISGDPERSTGTSSTQPLWFGLTALLLAGWPFWLIALSPDLSFSLDRFTLPFMMGSAVFLVGMLNLLPMNFTWKTVIFLIVISLSVGVHFRFANTYRRDWEVQRRFFWQLSWRIPGLKNGTTLLVNELPVVHYSDNSLTAPLNWIYAPENDATGMDYLLVYPARRLGTSLPALEENLPISIDYLAATYQGTTSQVVTVFFDPPACLRVLDNNLDALNHMLPLLMQHSAELSGYDNIIWNEAAAPMDFLYPEEEHGWCYFYEKAELARQQGDWKAVVELGESAFALGDYPNDPAERLPFIEGYAHTGNWNESVQQTELSLQVTPRMIPVLCLLWERIDQQTSQSPEKVDAVDGVSLLLDCSE